MKGDLKKLFSELGGQNIPPSLYNDIVFKLETARIKKARLGLIFQGVLSLVSFVIAFPIFLNVAERFSQSGFFQYLSLVFTDGEIVLSNWKVFASSLLESAPFYEATIFLAVVFVLLQSLKFAVRNLKIAQFHVYQPN